MGCFNITGFHTQIPLTCGDEAFILVGIYRNGLNKRDEFSPGTIFTPIALPILGIYDDYGCIMNIQEDENTKLIEKIFKVSIERFIEIIDDHSVGRYRDPKNTVSYEDLVESYLEYVKKNKPERSSFEFDEKRDLITFTMDHRFLYDFCSELTEDTKYYLDLGFQKTEILRKYQKRKVKEAKELLEKIKDKINKDDYEELEKANSSIFFPPLSFHVTSYDPNIRAGWIFGYGYAAYHDGDRLISLYFGRNSDLLFNQLREKYMKFLELFNTFTRQSWIFDMHNYCSQVDGTENLLPLHEKMVEFVKEKKKEYEEENEDYD